MTPLSSGVLRLDDTLIQRTAKPGSTMCRTASTGPKESPDFIRRSGRRLTDPFRKVITYITKTAIRLTTLSTILIVFRSGSISQTMLVLPRCASKHARTLRLLVRLLLCGTPQMRAGRGTGSMECGRGVAVSLLSAYVNNAAAGSETWRVGPIHAFVRQSAKRSGVATRVLTMCSDGVSAAASTSPPISTVRLVSALPVAANVSLSVAGAGASCR